MSEYYRLEVTITVKMIVTEDSNYGEKDAASDVFKKAIDDPLNFLSDNFFNSEYNVSVKPLGAV